jgi:NitT/TauT family transport system substrate-binding protein
MHERSGFRLIALLFIGTLLGVLPLSQARAADRPLKVALLPILDVLPFYVAEEEGYFKASGLDVKGVPVASGIERDQLMQSGEIDGMLTELTTTAAFNRHGSQVKIVRTARMPYPDFPLFRVLAAPKSGIKTPMDLAGIPIGVSMNTIIEYVTDQLLISRGLDPAKIVKKSIPVIPERFHLMMQGQIKASTLPDPLGKSALDAGAVEIVSDSEYPVFSVSVLAFRVKALQFKPEDIRLFLKGWDLAVSKINNDPESCRPIFLRRIPVPENIRKTYKIPPYPRNSVPDDAQWAGVMDWMKSKGLLDRSVAYEQSVTTSFLSQD